MTISLPVRVVLASGRTFNTGGFRLAVMGVLVVQGQNSWIVDDVKALDEIHPPTPEEPESEPPGPESTDSQIRIVDPTFLSRLSADIPPHASGDFAYFDTAVICGSTQLEANEVVLHDIWSVMLQRDGKWLRAIDSRDREH